MFLGNTHHPILSMVVPPRNRIHNLPSMVVPPRNCIHNLPNMVVLPCKCIHNLLSMVVPPHNCTHNPIGTRSGLAPKFNGFLSGPPNFLTIGWVVLHDPVNKQTDKPMTMKTNSLAKVITTVIIHFSHDCCDSENFWHSPSDGQTAPPYLFTVQCYFKAW